MTTSVFQVTEPAPTKSVRIVAAYQGGHVKVAKLVWAQSDASLYIIPSCPDGWSAKADVIAGVPQGGSVTSTAIYEHQGAGVRTKLSLHYSGQTHGYCGPNRTAPVAGRPLDDHSGGHIASIQCFNLAGLPQLGRAPSNGRDLDVVVPGPGEGTAQLKVALYASIAPILSAGPQVTITMMRPGMLTPLHVTLVWPPVQGQPTGDPGVIVIGGWGPGSMSDELVPCVGVWTGPTVANAPFRSPTPPTGSA